MPFIAHKLQAYFLNSSRWPLLTAMHCCKPVCQLQYAPLCRFTSTAQLSAVACLCSWTVMARRYWRSVGNSTGKYRYSEVGWPSGPSDVAETTNTGNTVLHVPMHHCDRPYEMSSSPLPFPFSPTTTSYRADAILKFAMCQSAPCHPAVGAKCCQCSLFSIYNNKYRVFNYLSPIHVHETVDRNYIWSLLTAWSRVLQKRKVSQLFKKFPHFTEHECSLPHSQVPATFP